MKKYLIITAIFLPNLFNANAQLYPNDMLRLSQQYAWGTARAMSMGGAFGSLGGDLSTLSINPAGIGVYRSSEFAITPSFNNNYAQSTFGNVRSDFSAYLNLSNIGFVRSFKTRRDEGWQNVNFGISYNRLNDFDRNVMMQRSNAPSSLLDEFTYYANGETSLNSFYEGLALDAGALYRNSNDSVFSDYSDPTSKLKHGEYQEKTRQITGGIGEWALSFGANYNNRFYIGVTLGIQDVNYQEISPLYEQAPSDVPNLSSFTFTEHLKTSGVGVNFKAGAIYRPIDMLRLGIAVHSPTFYNLYSEFYTSMDVDFKNNTSSSLSSQNILSFYNSLQTPWKGILSAAVVFKQFGLISVDYEMLDYRTMLLSGDAVSDQNSSLNKTYKLGNNIRIGAEGKIGMLALRAGYGYCSSPYKSGQIDQNANHQSYSAGFGFRGEHFFIDFAYALLMYPEHHILYHYNEVYNNGAITYVDNPALNTAKTDYSLNQYMMTVGFKF